jgi:hypothetical protein
MHILEETMENLKNQGLINAGRKIFSIEKSSINLFLKVMQQQCVDLMVVVY